VHDGLEVGPGQVAQEGCPDENPSRRESAFADNVV
jgi:hypothetical protein